MTRAIAALVAVMVLATVLDRADACTPIDFGDRELTPSSIAPQMVADAATIELMRVTSRVAVSADPVFGEIYATPIYRFEFESVEVLKGRSRGTLLLHGPGADARYRYAPDLRIERRDPLWWSGADGLEALYWSALLDPSTTDSIACRRPFTFDVGAIYLVFRSADGELLSPGFRHPSRPSVFPGQRPVIEIVLDDNDPWLRAVRATITQRHEGPDTFWDELFRLIFGNPR